MADIKIRELKPMLGMSIRFTTDMDNMSADMGKVYQEVWGYADKNGCTMEDCFAIYHDEVFDPKRIDCECGFSVKKLIPDSGRIKGREIEGGSMVSTVHTGPYKTLEKAYCEVMAWMKQNGCTPCTPMMEFYLNDPEKVPENELKTEILWPYKK